MEVKNDFPRNNVHARIPDPCVHRWDHWAFSHSWPTRTSERDQTSLQEKCKSLTKSTTSLQNKSRREAMKLKPATKPQGKACDIPRKQEAIEALLLLAWRKEKKARQNWLIKEIENIC